MIIIRTHKSVLAHEPNLIKTIMNNCLCKRNVFIYLSLKFKSPDNNHITKYNICIYYVRNIH